MVRVLVACDNKMLTKNLQDMLGADCRIESCGTGKWAVELYRTVMPDVVVVDDNLVDTDAFSLARAIRANGERVGIILLSTLADPSVESQAEKVGINVLILKPFRTSLIASHIRFLAASLKDPNNQNWNVEDELDVILADLNFRMGPDRYRCVRQAVLLRYADNSSMLMKNIYLEIAEMNGSTANSVEKAIRDAIFTAWNGGNPQLWDMYFRCTRNKRRAHPTNDEFVTRIATGLRRRERLKFPLIEEKTG